MRMRPLSLRLRLLLAGAAALIVALGLAAAALALLFDRHVERVAVSDLEARAMVLVAMVEPQGSSGAVLHQTTHDPLYEQPFSGEYWQIRLGERLYRSRSLWDLTLPMSTPPPPRGTSLVRDLTGPRGRPLLAIERSLAVGSGPDPVPLRILVAADREELTRARRDFLGDLLPYIGLLALLLLAASWAQITIGLQPLKRIGERVLALSRGARPRIGGDLPAEVMPLAGQIDQLLDARDQELNRARHRASDLAHVFKTPLQALLGDAQKLRDQGQTEIADSIETVVSAMRRLVDRELARTRIQSSRMTATARPAEVAGRIIRVLQRTPLGADLDWQLEAGPALVARIDSDDLTEALGALMENASRHARRQVVASVAAIGEDIMVSIRDDGPGVPEPGLERLLQRGVRLDQSADGQGIGLAIVTEIAEAAGGSLSLRNTPQGFCAELRLRKGAA